MATKTLWKYFPFSGAHTLGAAHRSASGFVGPWVQRQKQFSNQYFIDMFDSSLGEGDDAEGLKKESSISMGRYQVSKTAMGKVLQHFTFQTTCADQL